jgi:multisubunit Na+/H+ antiporter MnhB subunit
MTELFFDGLLCCFLIGLVWKVLTVRQLYQAVFFFIAFGLSMAMAWARLAAPDVALAEATIGAGLTGVLLIDSLRVFAHAAESDREAKNPPHGSRRRGRWAFGYGLVWLTGAAATVLVMLAIWRMPAGGGLTQTVAEAMPGSGAEHPVTAVLLNFRGYDTWLEVGVLLLAMFGLLVVRGDREPAEEGNSARPDVLLDWLTRALVPVLVMASGYLLWLGKFAPGGAFQSGVLLGAAVILLRLNGFTSLERLPSAVWRGSLVLGFVAFLVHGTGALLMGRRFLEFPTQTAGQWILGLEALAAYSIAFTLAAFFIGLHRSDRGETHSRQTTRKE